MRTKILILCLLCLLFVVCKGDSPTSPEPPYAIPIITYFGASPSKIMLGETSTLTWSVVFDQAWKGERVEIDNDIGVVDSKGSAKVSPTETTKYKLTAYGKGCNSIRETTIVVDYAF